MLKRSVQLAGVLFLACIFFLAVLVATTWAPDQPVANLTQKWAPAPSTFINLHGLNVHLRDQGPASDPLPIVLIHGTSSSLHTWEAWVDVLKTQHRVITMDLPGFGLTGPNVQDDYSNQVYVHFILDLMDKLSVQRFILGGNSLGGEIAWQVAASAPERVAKLILVDAAGYAFTPESIPLGFRIARTPVLNKLVELTLPRDMMEKSIRNVYGNPEKVTPELVDRYIATTLRAGNRHALVRRFGQLDGGASADKIKSLHLPTLILWGGKDKLIPVKYAQEFHRDIPDSQLQIFDQLGHVPQEEDAALTVKVVQEFLR
ncbi:alpha/beta hydrolase [Undibacterium sp. Jales W-56]|uniref:alpha/beta fold hydrolase n=1 Tax=Undibacterium sp. Jales W-56 TaxID=2897325 RepID=UPI0021D1C721|nr:alpha/beta hydrolase [Undibacterium sp. Jales W-56]MCU6432802.1 alpha/beta hydrolase [Undibacterium sp. Jales W-56]